MTSTKTDDVTRKIITQKKFLIFKFTISCLKLHSEQTYKQGEGEGRAASQANQFLKISV